MNKLYEDGYSIHRNIVDSHCIQSLRDEAELVATRAGSTCVRHLRHQSEIFTNLPQHPDIMNILPLGLRPVRSILFDKTASENWPVMWHQDLTITVRKKQAIANYGPWSHKDGSPHVQPPAELLRNMVTMRLHLDDTPSTNGALRVIPKSHRLGKIPHEKISDYTANDNVVTCECTPGDILLMNPLILHSSKRASKPSKRRIIHIEFARNEDLDSNLDWFEINSV